MRFTLSGDKFLSGGAELVLGATIVDPPAGAKKKKRIRYKHFHNCLYTNVLCMPHYSFGYHFIRSKVLGRAAYDL